MDRSALLTQLQMWGVFKGHTIKRQALALRLHEESPRCPTARDLRLLFLECKEGRKAKNPGAMLTTLLDSGDWLELIDDLRAFHNNTEATPADGERNVMAQPAMSPIEQEQREAAHVYAALVFDNHDADRVMADLGITSDELVERARKGCVMYGHDPDEDHRLRCALDPAYAKQYMDERRRAMTRKPTMSEHELMHGYGVRDPLDDLNHD